MGSLNSLLSLKKLSSVHLTKCKGPWNFSIFFPNSSILPSISKDFITSGRFGDTLQINWKQKVHDINKHTRI